MAYKTTDVEARTEGSEGYGVGQSTILDSIGTWLCAIELKGWVLPSLIRCDADGACRIRDRLVLMMSRIVQAPDARD